MGSTYVRRRDKSKRAVVFISDDARLNSEENLINILNEGERHKSSPTAYQNTVQYATLLARTTVSSIHPTSRPACPTAGAKPEPQKKS
jgi:hypothetical protein